MSKVTDKEIYEVALLADAAFWAQENGVQLLGGVPFTLSGCRYMGDVMRDRSRHIVVMKGTQARMTTAFMLREIHALIHGRYPQGSIYYFPNEVAVTAFSQTRFGPLIRDNAVIRKHLRATNNVSVKQVGRAFLSLKGCRATTSIQGKKDSQSVRSTPADSVVRDELDLFDDTMAAMTNDRLLNSTLKLETDLGSPTIPDIGIDYAFGRSDQKHWLTKCSHCGKQFCLATEFPESVMYRREDAHSRFDPYFGCIHCGKEVLPSEGDFVAKFPDRSSGHDSGVSGYHISHFITPNCNLNIVMDEWEAAQLDRSKMGLFYNKYLGFAYIDIEDRLTQQDVFNCCGDEVMQTRCATPTAMGADIMKTNRVVIAQRTGDAAAKIIYMARVSGFDALFDLVQQFNVKSAVVCLRPYEESFRKFQTRCYNYDHSIKVFGSEYKDRQKVMVKEDQQSGVYSLARTEAMDKSQSWIRSGLLEIPRLCDEVKVFAKECCSTAKTLEVNDDTGDRVYRYRPIGDKQEHYRHCVNYLWLAIQNLSHTQPAAVLSAVEDEYDPLTYGL